MRGGRARLDDDLAALDVLALDATKQQADVLAGLALVEQLAEHLDAGDRGGLLGFSWMPTMSTVSLTLRMPRSIRPVTTVPRPVIVKTSSTGIRNGLSVSRSGCGIDSSTAFISSRTLTRPTSASPSSALSAETRTTGSVVARELVLGQQLADLELDELQDLLVVDHVGLVQRDHDVGHADLAGEQHVLLGLRHRAVGGGDDQDRAVHLGRTGDHVLDVVGVTGAVDVRVVALLGLVLDVRDRDRDAALALLRSLVDLVELRECGFTSGYLSCSTLEIAAVSVVLPWSM